MRQMICQRRNRPRSSRLLLAPSRSSGFLCNRFAFGWREFLGSHLPPRFSAHLLLGGMPLGFANRVLRFADGDVEYLLGKLGGITRTFGHELSMPYAAPSIYAVRFQTEALPGWDARPPLRCRRGIIRSEETT